MKNRLSSLHYHCRAIGISLIALLNLSIATAGQLPPAVDQAIQESPLNRQSISLWIAPVDGGSPLVDYHSNTLRTPASVAKLITSGVSLYLLGENYRWKTDFYTDARITNNVLTGNLYIKGHGNPYLVEEALMDMVIELRNMGINHIQGDVILDNSYFINTLENPDFFDGHGLEPYNALPNALSINFRTIELIFDNQQGKIRITSNPQLTYTDIQNNMTFNKAKRCRGKGFRPIIEVDNSRDLIIVSGAMSRQCKHQSMKKVLTDAGDLFYGHFKQAWLLSGGTISGKWHYGRLPPTAKRLYSGQSKPLYEQIAAMNKHSNNLMTRQLFLTIGAELTQPPATLPKARAIVLNKLQALGIKTHGLFIDNGSGLSRKSKITAKQLGQFLLSMQDPRVKLFFEQSLAIVGVDGTLRRRLRNTPVAGNAIGKTGTLKNAKSVAGYLTAQSGKKYAYVMLFNGPKARAGRPLMDNIMQWLYQQ